MENQHDTQLQDRPANKAWKYFTLLMSGVAILTAVAYVTGYVVGYF